ncbi:hypothetical protein [Celeribacter ethanolicus]|uniref:hypothetical protein n=1 Tax=Celeribacter ethanolicus TaxID=1758178 RepID=UPI000835D003|nr:hypothetical protein [Celeribacter ethanolicus]
MTVELTPKLPARDFALLSYGTTPQNLWSDSLKEDAISRVNAMVILDNFSCEDAFSAHVTLRTGQLKSQDLGKRMPGSAGSHKVMCQRNIENAHRLLFRNLMGDA